MMQCVVKPLEKGTFLMAENLHTYHTLCMCTYFAYTKRGEEKDVLEKGIKEILALKVTEGICGGCRK